MAQLRLLACFAHPDDEAFTASGVLAASTARGVQVRLVCATCGEAGDIRQAGLATRETLGQVRYRELQHSCAVLGVQAPIMLGYRDSGWGDSPTQYQWRRPGIDSPLQGEVFCQCLFFKRYYCMQNLLFNTSPQRGEVGGGKSADGVTRPNSAAHLGVTVQVVKT